MKNTYMAASAICISMLSLTYVHLYKLVDRLLYTILGRQLFRLSKLCHIYIYIYILRIHMAHICQQSVIFGSQLVKPPN